MATKTKDKTLSLSRDEALVLVNSINRNVKTRPRVQAIMERLYKFLAETSE